MDGTTSSCRGCGEPLAAGLRFCTSCGTPVPEPAAVPASEELTETVRRPPVDAGCATCGAPLPARTRFCVSCGARVGVAPTAPPPPVSPAPSSPVQPTYEWRPSPPAQQPSYQQLVPQPAPQPAQRRSRAGLVVGVLLLLLIVGGAAAGGVVLLGGDDGSSATDGPRRSSDSASTEPESTVPSAAEPTPEASTTSAEPSPSETAALAPAPSVTCWDGDRVVRVSDCAPLAGKDALRWVFPGLDPDSCSSHRSDLSAVRLQIWACTGYLDDGTPIDLNYSQWSRPGPALSHYDHDAEVEGKSTLADGRVLWSITSRAGDYKAALMYPDEPWSVTVYASSAAARDQGVLRFATMRPQGQLLGVRD